MKTWLSQRKTWFDKYADGFKDVDIESLKGASTEQKVKTNKTNKTTNNSKNTSLVLWIVIGVVGVAVVVLVIVVIVIAAKRRKND